MIANLAQWAILPIYFIALILATGNLRHIYKCYNQPYHFILNFLTMITSSSYIILQTQWIVQGISDDIPSFVDAAWLIHEYMIGIVLLFNVAATPMKNKEEIWDNE